MKDATQYAGILGGKVGVKRISVTVVARTLQAAGLIKYSRGKIQILNMEALKRHKSRSLRR